MKKYIVLFALACLALVSCEKSAEYNQTLGLLSKYNVLSADGGTTDVAVFSNTDWTVKMDHEVEWASIDRFSGHKSGRVIFDFDINYGRARRVILQFTAGGETREIHMYQTARLADNEVVLKVTSSGELTPAAAGETIELPFQTNLIYNLDEIYLAATYPEGQEPETDWIILKELTLDKVVLEVSPNNTGAPRTANVRIAHTDAGSYDSKEGDTVASSVISVTQANQ